MSRNKLILLNMDQFLKGVRHFLAATSFLAKHKLLYFYLFPLALSIIYYVGLFALIFSFSREITEWLIGSYLPERDPEFDGFWSFLNFFTALAIRGILSFLFGLEVYMISVRFSKYIVLMLLSPVFAILSEKTDEIISGRAYPFDLAQFLNDMIRGIVIAIRNLFIELFLVAVFTLAGFFAGPLAVLVVPFLWLVSAYFYGFSMIDYTCERRKMSIGTSIEFIRRHRAFAIGNGTMYALFDCIPFVGLVIAPVNAVVGACTGLYETGNGRADNFNKTKIG
jgi:CysZ protein